MRAVRSLRLPLKLPHIPYSLLPATMFWKRATTPATNGGATAMSAPVRTDGGATDAPSPARTSAGSGFGTSEERLLIERSRKGELDAFDKLVRQYEKNVFNTAYRLSGSYEDASDIAQEAFVGMKRDGARGHDACRNRHLCQFIAHGAGKRLARVRGADEIGAGAARPCRVYRRLFFGRQGVGSDAQAVLDRLRVHPCLMPRGKPSQHDAVLLRVQDRDRERLPPAEIRERIEPHDADFLQTVLQVRRVGLAVVRRTLDAKGQLLHRADMLDQHALDILPVRPAQKSRLTSRHLDRPHEQKHRPEKQKQKSPQAD